MLYTQPISRNSCDQSRFFSRLFLDAPRSANTAPVSARKKRSSPDIYPSPDYFLALLRASWFRWHIPSRMEARVRMRVAEWVFTKQRIYPTHPREVRECEFATPERSAKEQRKSRANLMHSRLVSKSKIWREANPSTD